MIVLSSNRILG